MPGGNASETNRHRRISRPGSSRSTWRTICRPSGRRRCRAADTRRATPRRGFSSHRHGRFLDAPDAVVASHSSRARLNGPSIEAGRSSRSFSCASARLRTQASMSPQPTFSFVPINLAGSRRSATRASAYNRSQRARASIITAHIRLQPIADRNSRQSRTVQRSAISRLIGVYLSALQPPRTTGRPCAVCRTPRQFFELALRPPRSSRGYLPAPPLR